MSTAHLPQFSRLAIAAAMAFAAASAVHGQGVAASCDRECLRGVLDEYLAAMVKHSPSSLRAVQHVRFTENGEALRLGEGLWQSVTSFDYRFDAIDARTGQIAAIAVAAEKQTLATFFVRLKVAGGELREVETIVSRSGQADPFGPEKITAIPVTFTQAVPEAQRTPRDALEAIPEAYFTGVQTEGTPEFSPPPIASDANRFENGVQTTNTPVFDLPAASALEQLEKGFFKGLTITERRTALVDEERGIAVGVGLMHVPDYGGLLLAEMFKVTNGTMREIQAVLVNHPEDKSTGWR